jgi:hypothetical protein
MAQLGIRAVREVHLGDLDPRLHGSISLSEEDFNQVVRADNYVQLSVMVCAFESGGGILFLVTQRTP